MCELKPNSEGLKLALLQASCSPDRTIYVGDHEVDAAAARDVKVTFLGVRWSENEAFTCSSVIECSTPSEMAELVCKR